MRIRDRQRRLLQKNGWRARFRKTTGDWVWDSRRNGVYALHREFAVEIQEAFDLVF